MRRRTALVLASMPSMACGFSIERRGFLSKTAAALGVAASIADREANAACLPGDQSEDCIGVYKMPYMDAKDSFWINDKETLSIFAPDIRYVKTEELPATLDLAKQQLFDQRQQLKVVRNIVFDGDLRKAGVEVLRILPKVSSAGIKISEHIEDKTDFFDKESEKNFNTFDESMQGLLALWNGLDIEIGQALRGQRGVTAVAQIEILADLKELTVAFDDFLRVVETYT